MRFWSWQLHIFSLQRAFGSGSELWWANIQRTNVKGFQRIQMFRWSVFLPFFLGCTEMFQFSFVRLIFFTMECRRSTHFLHRLQDANAYSECQQSLHRMYPWVSSNLAGVETPDIHTWCIVIMMYITVYHNILQYIIQLSPLKFPRWNGWPPGPFFSPISKVIL